MSAPEELDTSLVGETVVGLMESLRSKLPPDEDDEDGQAWEPGAQVQAVLVVVCVNEGDRVTYRIKCSSEVFHEQAGLLYAGLDVLDG